MTGRGIGLQAIGADDGRSKYGKARGINAFFMPRVHVRALFSAAAAEKARYMTAQEFTAIFTDKAQAAAVWAAQYILHIVAADGRKDDTAMHTHIHGNIEARSGEPVEIVFNVTDKDGNTADLTLATAEYRLARRAGDAALLTRSSAAEGGIAMDGSTVTVTIDTTALMHAGAAMLGDFFGQLRITLDGRTLVVAEGPVSIAPVILPAI